MFSTAEKNYLINIALGAIGLACITTGLLLKFKIPAVMAYVNIKTFHEWTGYFLAALVILHFVMHLKWLQTLTKTMINSKQKLIATVLVLFLSVGLVVGLIMLNPPSKAPSEGRKDKIQQTEVKRVPMAEQTN